jgi:membrane protein implicated in regulation of membrane protease activity
VVAVSDVTRSDLLYNIARVKAFFGFLWVRLALAALGLMLLIFIVRRLFRGRRRRGRNSRYSGYAGGKFGGRNRWKR